MRKQKAREQHEVMLKISKIFGGGCGAASFSIDKCSPEMAAIILTRWAKRRLPFVREARIIELAQAADEQAKYQELLRLQDEEAEQEGEQAS